MTTTNAADSSSAAPTSTPTSDINPVIAGALGGLACLPAVCGPSRNRQGATRRHHRRQGGAIVVAEVATANPQERYTYCELADREREGLLKPSRVQVAPLFQIAQSELLNGEQLGVLSERDRRALNLALIHKNDHE